MRPAVSPPPPVLILHPCIASPFAGMEPPFQTRSLLRAYKRALARLRVSVRCKYVYACACVNARATFCTRVRPRRVGDSSVSMCVLSQQSRAVQPCEPRIC